MHTSIRQDEADRNQGQPLLGSKRHQQAAGPLTIAQVQGERKERGLIFVAF
jgi:hypothetical protein